MLNVVLIDDEYYFRNSLKKSIDWNQYGFTVIGDVNNGRSGYELIMEQQPEIAIVDINMPVLDGLELIAKLRENGNQCRCILLTGYDEFKYAQRAISLGVSEYILKPVDFQLLLEALLRIKTLLEEEHQEKKHVRYLEEQENHRIRRSFLLDLINCNFSLNDQQLETYQKELDITLDFREFRLALISMFRLSRRELEGLPALLEEFLPDIPCELFLTDQQELCLIGCRPGTIQLPALLHSLSQKLEQQGLEHHIGVSSIHQTAEQLLIACNEARLCLKNQITADHPVLTYEQINQTPYRIQSAQIGQLKKAIRQRAVKEVGQLLKEIFAEMSDLRISYDNILLSTIELISALNSTLSENFPTNHFETGNTGSILDAVGRFAAINELQDWIIGLFSEQIRQSESAEQNNSAITKKVEQFISSNYQNEELSIDLIAKQLFLNYSYLCYCFKRDRNMTINEYITQTRINRAVELCKAGQKNVSGLAEAVGYSDAGYFSKCFKKLIGLSPSQYLTTLNG